MKKYLVVMMILVVASCADPDLKPIVTYDDAGHGAYPKLMNEQGERSVDFFDIPNSQYTYSVEFIDDNNGNNVATYIVELTYTDINGDDSQGPIEYRTYDAASFGTSPDGNKSVDNVLIKATEMISALGLTEADISQADEFLITGTLVMNSGALHTGALSSATIKGAAFQGHFDINLAVVCPSFLDGTHSYSTLAYGAWCSAPVIQTGDITWDAVANGVYAIPNGDYAMGGYYGCYGADPTLPGGNLRINDLCNKLFWTGASRWGEIYTFNAITVAGPDLILDWSNDYGEAAVVTLTREGGADWPPLTN